ncbi:MAG: DUF2207 domain-containing protein, partial [Synergistaceae bacterium]|nr:DUF2207 domain-containing protein [Synergistaceae bacterium]
MAGIFLLLAATPDKAGGEGAIIEDLSVLATVTKDGILSVEETLTVLFDGRPLSADLTRGISRRHIRDGYEGYDGYEKNKTGFVLLDATLDGQPTKTDIQRKTDSLRLTLAARSGNFTPGRHIFKLKYELINMISFFNSENPEEHSLEGVSSDQDLLVWSLVRESSCPILRVSLEMKLPGSAGDPALGSVALGSPALGSAALG